MLTDGDRFYFDGKFGEVHEKLNAVKVDLAEHKATVCRDVVKHVDDCHKDSFLKVVSVFGTIVAIVVALLVFLKSHLFGG